MDIWSLAGESQTEVQQRELERWQLGKHQPRFARIGREYGPSQNAHRLVRLDVVLMAMHLIAAQYVFRQLSVIVRDQVANTLGHVDSWTVKRAIGSTGKTVGATAARLAKVATEFADILDADLAEGAKEVFLRKAAWKARSEVWNFGLKQGRNQRRTRTVATRHRSKKQRKKNKSWKSQQPRPRRLSS